MNVADVIGEAMDRLVNYADEDEMSDRQFEQATRCLANAWRHSLSDSERALLEAIYDDFPDRSMLWELL